MAWFFEVWFHTVDRQPAVAQHFRESAPARPQIDDLRGKGGEGWGDAGLEDMGLVLADVILQDGVKSTDSVGRSLSPACGGGRHCAKRPALMLPHPSATAPGGERAPWGTSKGLFLPLTLAIAAALLLAGPHLFQRFHSSRGFRLEFSVVIRTPCEAEVPRIGQLTVIHPDGSRENLISRQYVSGFLDLRSTFRFDIADDRVTRVLFAPVPGEDLVGITGISLIRPGNNQGVPISLDKLAPLSGVQVLDRNADRVLVRTTTGAQPAALGLALDAVAKPSGRPTPRIILETTGLFAVSFALFFLIVRIIQKQVAGRVSWRSVFNPAVLPFMLIASLILAMALLTKFNAHPDEYLHFETARYFVSHWFPPALNDPAIAPTFSHYGFSYMRDLDAAYFSMGKFMALFPAWLASPEIAARLFNVALFITLGAWLTGRLQASLAPFVLLISPQIWYVFSYVNGDAWALTLAMLIVVQLAAENSFLARYLQAEHWSKSLQGGVCFAVILALLLMAKRNYYLFLPFVALVAIWKTVVWRSYGMISVLVRKWGVIALLTAAFYFPLRAAQEAINGFDLPRLQQEQAEKYAAPRFKPSEIAAGKGSPRLVLRNQGVPFTNLLTERSWLAESFQSFCGVYRWMSLKGSESYYLAMGLLYAVLLTLLFLRIARMGWRDAAFVAATFGTALMVALSSVYHSWTADYQPQGRYLFPILPMVAFLFHRYRESLRSPAFYLLFGGLFACSIYSFVFTGLKNIPK